MKLTQILFSIATAILLSCGTADKELDIVRLENGPLIVKNSYLEILQEKNAGHITSMKFNDRELLFTPYGAKIFLAPEKAWPECFGDAGIISGLSAWELFIKEKKQDLVRWSAESPVEEHASIFKGLRLKSAGTLYPWSTVIKHVFSVTNTGTETRTAALWPLATYEVDSTGDFKAYFHRNRESGFGDSGFYYMANRYDSLLTAPRVFLDTVHGTARVTCKLRLCKLGIDTDEGWIALVNEHNRQIIVHSFEIQPWKTYPDSNVNLEIFIGRYRSKGSEPILELEVLGPVKDVLPGDSAVLEVWWGHGTGTGAVVFANKVGAALDKRLFMKDKSIAGSYTIFYAGTVRIDFYKNKRRISGEYLPVSPSCPLIFEIPSPAEADSASITVLNKKMEEMGILDWFPNGRIPVSEQ